MIAFSHAITARRGAPAGRAAIPAAMFGATKRRMCAPTAVVTMSAEAICSVRPSGSFVELIALKPSTTVVAAFWPTVRTS